MRTSSYLIGLAALFAIVGAMRNPREKILLDAILRRAGRVPPGAAAPASANGGRILGGQNAAAGQFPWQGSLQYTMFGHICGLSILSENFAVTAAHCVEGANDDPSILSVLVGVTNLDSSGQRADIERIYIHESYDNQVFVNDVALLEFATPLQLNSDVQPITIGVGRKPVSDENGCTISGWGATDENGFFYPDDLQFLDVTFYDDATCAQLWAEDPEAQYTNEVHLCAGTESGDNACFGDSGGPIVCTTVEDGERYLFGATSFGGSQCGHVEWPDVWTELPYFIDWIEDKTGPLPRP